MISPRRVLDAADTLGECPVWDEKAGILWWVDIELARLRSFRPADGTRRDWTLPERIGALALRRGGGLVLALASGFALFDPGRETLKRLPPPPGMLPGHRFNDGACDAAGRFWAGTMQEETEARDAGLYCLEPSGVARRVLDGFGIVNGIAWSPDGGTFHIADSALGEVRAHDFEVASGRLGPARRFDKGSALPGVPDGAVMDAEGGLWSARHGGGCVVRHRPDGEVDRIVPLPVEQPTCCAFGGPDLATLFVTSARQGMDEAQLRTQPWAGDVLAFEPGVRGLPAARFAG